MGTLKVPARFYSDNEHSLKIYYQKQIPDIPVVTELIGAELVQVDVRNTKSIYKIRGLGTTDLRFSSPEKPCLFLDQNPISFFWSEKEKTGHTQMMLKGEHQLIIQRKF